MLKEDLKKIKVEHLLYSNEISVRTANCCLYSGLNTLYDIISLFEKKKSFLKIKITNAGRKTSLELNRLCETYISKLENEKSETYISKLENKKTKFNRNDEIIQVIDNLSVQAKNILFSLASLIIKSSKISNEQFIQYGQYFSNEFFYYFLKKQFHLPMFWILEQHIKKDKSREIAIITDSFNIFNNQQILTLDELSKKYNLSRERIRQIRKMGFRKTFEINDEIIEYKKRDLVKYGLILQNKTDWLYLLDLCQEIDILCQESQELQNYLKEEKCNLSIEFSLHIIAYIFRDNYCLMGSIDKLNKSKKWNNIYLIKREYFDIFDFDKMKIEFCNKLMNNDTDYIFNIEDYIFNSQCWIKFDYNKTGNLINIVKDLLLHEFHLYSDDINGNIKIPANKEKRPTDVVYQVLKQTGRPMHLNEIFDEFKVILSNHKYTEPEQIRPYLLKHEAISFRNRNSVYTLKEWKHIKSGTIRDTIIEFLLENDLPKTAEDIIKYVTKYFPDTNISSIRTTMLNDTQKRFVFFRNNTFGLRNKNYPSKYKLLEQKGGLKISFEQHITELEKFIINYKKFPSSSSETKNEQSLFRWWSKIKEKQILNENQKTEIKRIIDNYSLYEANVNKFDSNFNILKKFILKNRRIPLEIDDEKYLYRIFCKIKDDFLNYNMSEEQRKQYIELMKLT